MNKNLLWLAVIVAGLSIWAHKIINAVNAYEIAKQTIDNRLDVSESLGDYSSSYDWWFGVFRALKYGEVQEFEFHLEAIKSDATGVVEVTKNTEGWKSSCVIVVNGEYLNNRIVDDCDHSRES